MSSLTLNLKSMDSMRSLLPDGAWFHMSLQNLQKWHGWNYFGNKSTLKNASSTFYVGTINESTSQQMSRHVSEEGAEFFEKFASIRQRAEQPRRTVQDIRYSQNTLRNGGSKTHPRPAPRSRPKSRLYGPMKSPGSLWVHVTVGREAEDLYQEAVYSVLHGLGNCSEHEAENQLSCLRRAFRYSEEKHLELVGQVHQKPAPEVALQVVVVEGRNLRGKGANGLSDPFCSIWLASCKQRQQNTTMKPDNLDPVWNEQFEFPMKNAQDDMLHVEVWDFDPDETVVEKLARVKQVKGCKGFGKLLKEIAVASKGSGKPAHEFLGLFSVPLKNVPVLGMERWFTLEGREKKKVKNRGEIKLQLSLITKNTELQRTLQQSLDDYEKLVKVFVDSEIRSNPDWNGVLGESESDLLRFFGAQRGLRPLVTDLVYWCVLSEGFQVKNLDCHLLWNILERSRKYLEDVSTPKEVELMFWKAAEIFVNTAVAIVRSLPNNSSFSDNPEQLRSFLLCLREIKTLDKLKNGGKFSSLDLSIQKAMTLGAADWFDQVAGYRRMGGTITDEDDRIESCIQICQDVMADLKRALTAHNEIFIGTLQIPYFPVLYEYYDSQLASICCAVVDSATRSLKSLDFDENALNLAALEACGESHGPDLTNGIREMAGKNLDPKVSMGTALFELYLSLQQFQKLSTILSKEENDRLRIRNFHTWFSTAVGRWLSIALYKALVRIGKAVSIDSFVPVDGLVKHSNSAVDAVTIFYQIKTFWQQLAWPDAEGTLTFAMKIMDDICRCCTFYADVVDRKLQKMISNPDSKFIVSQQILCIIHNVLHVRQSIRPIADALEIRNLFLSLQQPTTAIETVLDSAEENIDSKLEEMYFSIARRIEASVAKFLYFDWDSTSSSAQLGDLILYLDTNLVNLKSQLEPPIFDQIVRIIGERVMHTILNAVNADIDNKRPPSYLRHWDDLLKLVTNFFYGDSNQHAEDEVLGRIRRLLKVHSSETVSLIHQYCLERLRLKSDDAKYGKLSVRALFVNENLIVEVLNARNLKATNSRGSCDPYVKVELMLTEKCAETVHKTKVHKNTLFPLFDETFTFKVPLNLQLNPECFILFRLKDHDSLVFAEFVAETHLEFQNIQRGSSASELQEQPQIHLTFSRNFIKDSEYLQILENRATSDKLAKEFIKKEKKRIGAK